MSIYNNGEYRTAGLAYNNEVSALMQVSSVNLESRFTKYFNSQVGLSTALYSSAKLLHGHILHGFKRHTLDSK